jgi:outer membrane protein insertion porin family
MTATWFTSCKNITYAVVAVTLFLFSSCSVVTKNHPKGKPFVYDYSVTVEGNYSPADKAVLESRLARQLDDSIRVRTVRKFIYKGVNRPVLENPPLYSADNVERSKLYMKALLVSLGYFKDTITHNVEIDTIDAEQLRATVNFNVKPGKAVTIDSFSYNLDSLGYKTRFNELQNLAVSNSKNAMVKKGEPFAKANISTELDRLVELYRNNGYMRFGRDELYGLWDTLDVSLLQPNLDPFEQLELLEKIRERRLNPKANLEIRLRPVNDSSQITKYYVGDITIYADYTADSTNRDSVMVKGVKIVSFQDMFVPKIFPSNLSLHRGDVYDQRNYLRTINRFNQIGSWRLVNIEQNARKGQDTADFIIKLSPAKKYSFVANLEGSRNENAVSGNLLGIAVNASLQNRNFARRANQANTSIRFGIETGKDDITKSKFIQTRQLSVGHTIYFPRAIFPMNRILNEKTRATARSVISIAGTLTERRELYNLNTATFAYGYDFKWGKSDIYLRWPNIEYSSFLSKPKLDSIIKNNPSLRNIFTEGLIFSVKAGSTRNIIKGKRISQLRLNGEVSGVPALFKNSFFDKNLYRFVKADVEYVTKKQMKKGDLVYRFFAGVGNELTSTVSPDKQYNLPFFRQYFAGGPNSMRAWGLRKLGPGSLIQNFDTSGIPDRFGDLQLEANVEYRFPFFKLFGIPIQGALFTDMGNIWLMRKPPAGYDESVFKLSRLGQDIAIGSGIGFRLDFSIFVVRLDLSHKVKDPSPNVDRAGLQNKWFGYVKNNFWEGTQFQLGISYPFIQ